MTGFARCGRVAWQKRDYAGGDENRSGAARVAAAGQAQEDHVDKLDSAGHPVLEYVRVYGVYGVYGLDKTTRVLYSAYTYNVK
ncbi:hypothetical protein TrVFT333_009785 [Trichoderma virens FT-333]|nr:hypothetical protein TrVFT333_009785 [Trichoderma virens FT-333]